MRNTPPLDYPIIRNTSLDHLSTPEDFLEDPYTRGLNQMGHALLSGALLGLTAMVIPLLWSVLVVTLGIILWELWQLKTKGATKKDYREDLRYWGLGVAFSYCLFTYTSAPLWVFLPFILVFLWVYLRGGGRVL